MKITSSAEVEMLCYQMRLADFTRGQNRALVDDLMNGVPPYSDDEVAANQIKVNVNYLEGTRIATDARRQFSNAFQKPGRYFSMATDCGPGHKRSERGLTVTNELARIMKRSNRYFECLRSKFALLVMHGIGPAVWQDRDRWCNKPLGISDVMLPSSTLLTMEDTPFAAFYRTFTYPEFMRLTKGPRPDPGWNKPVVEACIKWLDEETLKLLGNNWPDVWTPERYHERIKESGAFYAGDLVPTINAWDFYYYSDDGKQSGWKRRMVLDNWSMPTGNPPASTRIVNTATESAKGNFLYNPGDRIFANQLSELVSFQFADLSAVAPFRYHSVRSLGFMMYSLLHLQNRMRCRFSESVFEALMMYFRVKGSDDYQRALKVELVNRGFIDDTIEFLKPEERYQVRADLVELGLKENAFMISQNAAPFTSDVNRAQDVEKTKFQVMSEVSAMTSLVQTALMQAYQYQEYEYKEIVRRFMRKDSKDPDVREFQARVVKHGVPLGMLDPNLWELTPERVVGAGNKALELAIAQQLMQFRSMYDPGPQREILREVTLAVTDDPGLTQRLVPPERKISNSVHDAQLRFGSLMQGVPVSSTDTSNHTEVVESLLDNLSMYVKRILDTGGTVSDQDQLIGMMAVGQHIAQEIAIIEVNETEAERVRSYNEALKNIMNHVKAFVERFAEAQQETNGEAGPGAAEEMAKVQAQIQAEALKAQAKTKNLAETHSQKTAQRQVQFDMQLQQKQRDHEQKMSQLAEQHRLDMEALQAETAIKLKQEQISADLDDAGRIQEAQHDAELKKAQVEHQKTLTKAKAKAAKAAPKKKAASK